MDTELTKFLGYGGRVKPSLADFNAGYTMEL